MGTFEVFSSSYCANKNSCVLVDAWLELFLCFCSFLVVCALLVASRCCWLCGRRRTEETNERNNSLVRRVLNGTTRGLGWRVRRLLRKCGIRVAGRTSPLPMAVIKKDATAARIHGHKNSQQQGEAFILQTQRMYHMDFAQSPPLEEGMTEESHPQVPPLIFPEDDRRVVPIVIGAEKPAVVRSGSVVVKKRDPSKHMLSTQMTRQRSKSAMDPPKSTINSKVRAVSISVSRSSRNILAAAGISPPKGVKGSGRGSGSRTDSTDSMMSDHARTNSFKKKFQIFKKRTPSRAQPHVLFNEPSYETKNEMAELSPEDRAENERRASMQLRDKRRVSVGVSSHVQFQVGGDQASVYEVKLREVNLVKRLASGPLSEVYAAIWRDTKVGVKLLMPREGVVDNLEEAVKNFRREIWVMHALKHPNIVKLLGASLTQSCYVLIMEYMPNGSLYEYLRDAANFFPNQLVVTSAFDIALGMAHTHACDVLQRDLKSKNCLLSENLVVKVSDFGLARFRSLQYGPYTWVGTPFWAAPEVIRHEPYDEKADVYSYGIVLWELVERKDPYDNLNAFQVPLQVANEGLRPADFSRPGPLGLEQLMRQCWDADPEQRPSFADISQTLGTWLRTQSCEGDDSSAKNLLENDGSVDLSAHIQRGQITATQAELHRFAESHDANAKVIPITLSSLRKGLSTSRLQRARSTKHDMTASEIEELRINSTIGIPGLEEYGSYGRVHSRDKMHSRLSVRGRRATPPFINAAQLETNVDESPNEEKDVEEAINRTIELG